MTAAVGERCKCAGACGGDVDTEAGLVAQRREFRFDPTPATEDEDRGGGFVCAGEFHRLCYRRVAVPASTRCAGIVDENGVFSSRDQPMHRKPQLVSLALCVGSFASFSVAQSTRIVPQRFAAVEAESFTGIPFGRSTGVRVQHYYGGAWFHGKTRIQSIAFRPNGGSAFAAKGVEVEIFLSTGPRSNRGLSTTFAKNRGADVRLCFRRKKIRLPAVAVAPGPRPFSAAFALDTVFLLDPSRGGLLAEIVVHGQQPGRWQLDLGTRCASNRASFGRAGCKGSNARVARADVATQALLAGKSFVMRVRDVVANGLVLAAIGARETGSWMGLSLPYAMDSIGAPGCTLNTDVALALAGAANALGEARVAGRLPATPALVGAWFRFQAIILDKRANALGLVLSNGSKTQVCGPDPLARVVATPVSAARGTLELGLVPVTQFGFR